MKKINYSRQREAIKSFLLTRKDHPTAEVVFTEIRKEYPNISLGTVYRNLSLLTELGEIQKLSCGDDKEHYDADISVHSHFICRNCHAVIDLDMDNLNFINSLAQANFTGMIEGHCVHFFGLCPKCLEKMNSKAKEEIDIKN